MSHARYSIDQLLEMTRKNWPAASTTTHEFAMTLARLMEVTGRTHARLSFRHKLSAVEFDVLATLRKAAPPYEMTPTELQKAVVITSGGLTKVLYQLEARKLIRRSIDSGDRRSKRAQLTRAGKSMIERAMTALLESHEQALGALPPRELRQLVKLLQAALTVLDQ